MRSMSPAIMTHLAARQGLHACLLVWISARNRDSGAMETIGFWTGADHQEFTINGQTRLYYGAGAPMEIPALITDIGLDVRTHRMTFSPLAPEVAQAIRGYDPRLAPIEMHRAYFWPDSHELVDAPERVFKGRIEKAPITTPAVGGQATCELSMVSSAHALTRTLALKKSDNALRERAPDDGFRRHIDVTGQVETAWGEKRSTGPAPKVDPTPEKETERPTSPSCPGP